MKMKLWYFRQTPSHGYDKTELLFGKSDLIVASETKEQAIEIAQEKYGVYFDGVAKDFDCECCGDRWSEPEEYPNKWTHFDYSLLLQPPCHESHS